MKIKKLLYILPVVVLFVFLGGVRQSKAAGAGCCEVQCPVQDEAPIVGCITLRGGNADIDYLETGAGEVLVRDCIANSYFFSLSPPSCADAIIIQHPNENCSNVPACPEGGEIPPSAMAGCIRGTACPPGQVETEGPCPGGWIACIAETPPTPAPSVATPPPTQSLELPNPLGTQDFIVVLGRMIKVLTGASGTIGLLMFIYGGFQWLTAAGSPEKIKKGRDIFMWALLGMIVMFGSYLAVRFILTALTTGELQL